MTKTHQVIMLIISAVFMGCSSPPNESIHAWEEKDLNNLTVDLTSDTHVEWLSFGSNGYVSVTTGLRGGPLVAPLFIWKIDTNGKLLISEENGSCLYEIRKIELTDSQLIAEVNGEKQTYKILK